ALSGPSLRCADHSVFDGDRARGSGRGAAADRPGAHRQSAHHAAVLQSEHHGDEQRDAECGRGPGCLGRPPLGRCEPQGLGLRTGRADEGGVRMEYPLISADDHIDLGYLPPDLWTARLPERLRERAPHVEDPGAPNEMWMCEGENWGDYRGARYLARRDRSVSAMDRGKGAEPGRPANP